MPELPEVETVRRMLAERVVGRTVRTVALSGLPLRGRVPRTLGRRLTGRTMESIGRHGKYLLIRFDGELTVIAHLGMSGRWLFFPDAPVKAMPHVHVRIAFRDGSELWFQDPRRFGSVKAVATSRVARDPSIAVLGPDPIEHPPTGSWLHAQAQGLRAAVKLMLLDQRRLAGVGNIYASEILHRAGVDPRRPAGRIPADDWERIAEETRRVLDEAIGRFGTTFSMYRTLWNEPGSYGDQLRVYDRAGQPCRICGNPIRRIVQGARSTFFCPRCQGPQKRRSGQSLRKTR
jgi:formamidopyrimidine-DNA glycosylase